MFLCGVPPIEPSFLDHIFTQQKVHLSVLLLIFSPLHLHPYKYAGRPWFTRKI